MESKILQLFVNGAGQKIKTSGNLTISQYSTNNELHLITIGELASVTATFRDPAGNLSSLYHMVLQGKYALTEDDQEAVLVENADNLYDYFLPIPKKVSGIFVSGTSARLNVSFAGYAYDSVSNVLKQSMTAATQITVNKADSSVELDEGYNAVDVENMWIALNENAAKDIEQDGRLTTLESDNTSNKNRLTAVEGRVTTLEGNVSSLGTRMTAAEGAISGIKNGSSINSFAGVESALATKQNVLTAGSNITISGSTISATDTTYTAGFGLSLTGTEFNVNSSVIQEKLIAGSGISINNNVISFSGVGVSYQVVSSLPVTGEPGVIYLMSNSGSSPNVYDEYIYVNNGFELIGTTETDLSNYYTKSQADAKYVGLTGAQTVAGAKTFSSPVYSSVNDINFIGTQGKIGFRAYMPGTTTNAGQMLITTDETVSGSYRLSVQAYDSTLQGYNTLRLGDSEGFKYIVGSNDKFAVAKTGAITVFGNIIPSVDNSYDLGSSSYKFKDIYMSSKLKNGSNYLDLDGKFKISSEDGSYIDATDTMKLSSAGCEILLGDNSYGTLELSGQNGAGSISVGGGFTLDADDGASIEGSDTLEFADGLGSSIRLDQICSWGLSVDNQGRLCITYTSN